MELMEKENLVLFNQQVKNKKDKNKDEKQHELLLRQRLRRIYYIIFTFTN